MREIAYDRERAVAYAHEWAYRRNPEYYDFEEIGGDCTNFASQCVYAGAGVMNRTPVFGWYYLDAYERTASWTGVEYFYNFMVNNDGIGPFMAEVPLAELLPGDLVQLKLTKEIFSHTPVVVAVGSPAIPENILLAAHSYDADYRPLSTYDYRAVRGLHVLGVRTEE